MTITRYFRAADVSFSFDAHSAPLFESLNFDLQAGKLTFLQGKNGVGKSTLFRLLQGIMHPDEQLRGTFELQGIVYPVINNHPSPAYTRHVKAVVQNVASMIAPDCTGAQNIQIARVGTFPTLAALPALPDMNQFFGNFAVPFDILASRLSGGQRQLLAIAMVLQKPTKLLLLDEPTAALDEQNAHMVIEAIKTIAAQHHIAALMITHEADIVAQHKDCNVLILTQKNHTKCIEHVR